MGLRGYKARDNRRTPMKGRELEAYWSENCLEIGVEASLTKTTQPASQLACTRGISSPRTTTKKCLPCLRNHAIRLQQIPWSRTRFLYRIRSRQARKVVMMMPIRITISESKLLSNRRRAVMKASHLATTFRRRRISCIHAKRSRRNSSCSIALIDLKDPINFIIPGLQSRKIE